MSLFECVFCSDAEQQNSPAIEPQTETDESKSEPLTVIQQEELVSPQATTATSNQAMKGTCVDPTYDIKHRFFFKTYLPSSCLLKQSLPACPWPFLHWHWPFHPLGRDSVMVRLEIG